GLLVCLANLALAAAAARVFHLGGPEVALMRRLLLVAAVTALAWWPLSVGVRVLGGLQRYTQTAAVSAGMAVANAIAAVGVGAAPRSPLVLATPNAAVSLVAVAIQYALARRGLAAHGVTFARPRREALRLVLAFSGPVFVLQLAVQVLYHHTDRLLLGMFV